MLAEAISAGASHVADRFSAPSTVHSDDYRLFNVGIGGGIVVAEGFAVFALGLLGYSHVIEGEGIFWIEGESLLKQGVGFANAAFGQEPHGSYIGAVDLRCDVMESADGAGEGFAFEFFGARFIDASLGRLGDGHGVELLSTFDLAFELGDVAEVIEGEGVAGIVEVGFVEKLASLLEIALVDSLHAFAVKSLYRCQLAAFWDGDFDVFGGDERGARGDEQSGEEDAC